ncbi:unnamed protein product [Calypogeia fissa]
MMNPRITNLPEADRPPPARGKESRGKEANNNESNPKRSETREGATERELSGPKKEPSAAPDDRRIITLNLLITRKLARSSAPAPVLPPSLFPVASVPPCLLPLFSPSFFSTEWYFSLFSFVAGFGTLVAVAMGRAKKEGGKGAARPLYFTQPALASRVLPPFVLKAREH